MVNSSPDLESEEKRSVVSCIICGKSVDPDNAVRYMDWICHPECVNRAVEEKVEGFNDRYFIVGAIGALIGILGSFILISIQPAMSESVLTNPSTLYLNVAISYALIALGILIHSVGLYGLHRNYTQPQGLLSAGIAIVDAAFFSGMSILIFTYGLNPDFLDPETGHLLLEEILLYTPLVLAAMFLFGVLSVIVAITIWMLEKELKPIIPAVIITIVLVVNVGVFLIIPHSIIVYFGILFWVFYNAGVPKYWSEIEG